MFRDCKILEVIFSVRFHDHKVFYEKVKINGGYENTYRSRKKYYCFDDGSGQKLGSATLAVT